MNNFLDDLLTALICLSALTLVLGIVSLFVFRKTSSIDLSAKRYLTVVMCIVITHAAILDLTLVFIRAMLRAMGTS